MTDDSLEVKVARLERYKDDIRDIKIEMVEVWAEIRTKVSLRIFIPAMFVLILCLGGILGFQGMQVWKIAETGNAAALVQGEMRHVQESIKELKQSIKELPGRLNGSIEP